MGVPFSISTDSLVTSCGCALIIAKLEAKSMTAIAIAATPMATPDEASKEEDALITARTEKIFSTKIRLVV
jgi:hypothetical protein